MGETPEAGRDPAPGRAAPTAPPGALRLARPEEAEALASIATAAYARYVPRSGRPPGPMLADYHQVLADAEVWVAEDAGRPVGFAVLTARPGHLLLENVAVHPDHQGHGIGRDLLDHAEQRARDQDLPQVRLYTHETMTENLAIYRARGYRETVRAAEDGYRRVHLTKPLRQAAPRTERLTLVPLADEHLDDEVALDADPDVMRYLGGPRSRTSVEARHQVRLEFARQAPGLGFWAGILHQGVADDGFAGWWVLLPPTRPAQGPGEGQAELGYRLRPRYWRQGLAGEGARELLRHGFADLGLDRIFAETMTVNTASRATMASIGMRYVRTFHQPDDDRPGADLGQVEYAVARNAWADRPQPTPVRPGEPRLQRRRLRLDRGSSA